MIPAILYKNIDSMTISQGYIASTFMFCMGWISIIISSIILSNIAINVTASKFLILPHLLVCPFSNIPGTWNAWH